ncbi:hypothetical protein ABWI00_16605 [Algihabitans albus]|uniref:hypothetical protein n=1 Tax=Algihabitans albus TaxID=2164067 RepID=UPI0035D065D4
MQIDTGQVRLGTDFFQALQGLPRADASPLPGAGVAAESAAAVSQTISIEGIEAAESAARAAAEAGENKPRGSYLDIRA